MSAETVFNVSSFIAFVGWVLLLAIPFWDRSDQIVVGVIVTMLTLTYAWLIVTEFKFANFYDFGSLQGVGELFENQRILVAGWVHYLAFDLMAGLFIKQNAIKHRINFWMVIPCLVFTFLLGPIGLLIYFLVRWASTGRYFAEN